MVLEKVDANVTLAKDDKINYIVHIGIKYVTKLSITNYLPCMQ